MKPAGTTWIGTIAVLAILSPPLLGQRPPTELKLVGDHWTAWDPPAGVAEGAEVYVIQPGDTLWDLAERVYGNPYLWPQIWERNQYILDAHWIYPGDPLVMGIEVESAAALEGQVPGAPGTTPGAPGTAPGQPTATTAGVQAPSLLFGRRGRETPFVQLGTSDDIYCSGYVGELDEEFPYRVIGSEYELQNPAVETWGRGKIESVYGNVDTGRMNLAAGDIVYLDGGRAAGIAPGDVFTAVGPGVRVPAPGSGNRRTYGRHYNYLGRVRVLSVQTDSAIAEISQSCDPIRVGTQLKPFVPEPIPSDRRTPMRPANMPASPTELETAPFIVHSSGNLISLGEDHVVFVGMGEGDNVAPGDIFTIYRAGRRGNPPLVLGEAAILSVHPLSSVAKIIASRYPIYIGDQLVPK